jgi:hypothetical protein
MALKRWKLMKVNHHTFVEVEITPPEPRRHYWTRKGALREQQRLNASMRACKQKWRYFVRLR